MDDMVLVTLAVAVILVSLIVTTVIVAARADQAVTIKGPLATIGELQARIEAKRNTLAELEAELAKRREAIGQIADMQAEVDALTRKLDELQTEWHQLDERRREIEAVRHETEVATDELVRIEAELVEKRAELDRVAADLERAERLMREHEALTADHEELARQVAELRSEVAELTNLKMRADDIREEIETLSRRSAELQGRVDELTARQEQAQAEARAAQERLAELRNALTAEEARHAALARDLSGMAHQRAELLAQIEALKEKTGLARTDGDSSADPLKELVELPPVLTILRKWPLRAQEEEGAALQRVRTHMKNLGLHYPDRVLRAFHTAMKVNDTTQMAVLAGISGTGKSQLPRRYAQAMGIGFLQVPVQPRWDSPQDLMGFYNYIESRYRPTDLARTLYHLDRFNGRGNGADLRDRMVLVLLDEMNLARVEYYFSDFLSRLESRPPRNEEAREEARKDSEIELDIPMPEGRPAPRIYPGYNLLFAGTMNEDESTQSLSDKVVDRANVLRFAAPRRLQPGNGAGHELQVEALSHSRWRGWLRGPEALGADHRDRITKQIEKLLELMSSLGRPFGHRLGRAMLSYVANYPHDGHTPDYHVPLADQVEMRLLPKLRGVETETAAPALEQLAKHVEEGLNDPELARAIGESLRHAEEGTGQFLWRGVSRA